jgi:hypothetical protein
MYSADVLEPLVSLKACGFVDYVKQWVAANIYNIDNNTVIKLNVVL